MKINQITKFTIIIVVISFFCLYFTTTSSYYEYNQKQKSILTEEAIKQFEKDVANGKKIIASNYITEEKDYNNKTSIFFMKCSNLISEIFDKTMKYIFKKIECTVNN